MNSLLKECRQPERRRGGAARWWAGLGGGLALALSPLLAAGQTPPVIQSLSPSGNHVAGETVLLEVTATPNESLSFQWSHAGSPIPDAVSASLLFDPITTEDTGTYQVVVTNLHGTTTSGTILLDVAAATTPRPWPTYVPSSVLLGSALEVSVNPNASAPYTVEWYRDGGLIQSGESTTFTIEAVAHADAGHYVVKVINFAGATEVTVQNISVYDPVSPTISYQPSDQETTHGSYVFLYPIFHATGTAPLAYELLRGDEVVLQTPYTSSFRLGPMTMDDVGEYRIRVRNDWGDDVSEPFYISLDPGDPPSGIIAGVNGPVEAGRSFSLYISNLRGGEPRTYQWFKDGISIPDATHSTYSKSNVTLADAASYHVEISNLVGSYRSPSLGIRVTQPQTPEISAFPSQVTGVLTGSGDDELVLTVDSLGNDPRTYRWTHNGVTLPDETTRTLRLHSLSLDHAGNYTVVVNNAAGSSPARTIQVDVIDESDSMPVITRHPAGAEISSGEGITLEVDWDGAGTVQWYYGNTAISGATDDALKLRVISRPEENLYLISPGSYHATVTRGTSVATSQSAEIRTYSHVGTLPQIVSQPRRVSLLVNQSAKLRINLDNYAFVSYRWFKDGELIEGARSYEIQIEGQPSAAGVYSIEVNKYREGTVVSEDITVTVDSASARPVFTQVPGDLKILPRNNVQVRIDVGPPTTAIRWEKDGEPYPAGNGQYSLFLQDFDGPSVDGVYRKIVTTADGDFTSPPVQVSRITDGMSPRVRLQPIAQTLETGSQLRLEITAEGEFPITYQWMRDGEPIPGADSYNLFVNDFSAADVGEYSVVVTNENGTAESDRVPVSLKPQVPPRILKHPDSLVEILGQGAYPRLAVHVDGSPSFHYQWYRNNVVLENTDRAYIYLNSLGLEDNSGEYHVVVSNALGSVTSNPATVVVNAPFSTDLVPSFRSSPESVQTNFAHPVSLQASAEGGDAIHYQWRKNGEAIENATQETLLIDASSVDQTGLYSVIASNPYGTTSSNGAWVTIQLPDTPIIAGSTAPATPVSLGSAARLSITAAAATSMTYQWRKDGRIIPGATAATLNLDDFSVNDAGIYTVDVASEAGRIASRSFSLRVVPPEGQAVGTHQTGQRGLGAGDRITLFNRILVAPGLERISWETLLPEGWSLVSTSGSADSAPTAGTTGLAAWSWDHPSEQTLRFSYVLQAPVERGESPTLSALLTARSVSGDHESLARPDPLELPTVAVRHSADTDQDYRLSLSELLRVIELYNTRQGTARTGRYRQNIDNPDGFETDPATPDAEKTELADHHAADTDRDGHLSLSELLRVIELYNTRSGSTRTGAYHRAAGTADGFAPQP